MTKKFKIPKRISFRTRLFIVMISLLVIAGLMILGTTTIQYESQRENYHLGRLTRKEIQIVRHIDYLAEKHNLVKKGKAGVSRHQGIRPTVRGVAMNPIDHPHGGGEGRTSGGRHPCSPTGLQTKGKKTRSCKRTDHMIIKRRSKKKRR